MNSLKTYPLAEDTKGLNMELTRMEVVDESEDIRYTTYGVRVIDSADSILFSAPDISTQEKFVQRFVEICVQGQASVIHLPDLLEDYLV